MIDLAKERRRRGLDRLRSAIASVKETVTTAFDELISAVESLEESALPIVEPPQLADFKTAAKFLNVSEATIYNLAKHGKLPVVEIPGEGEKSIRRIDLRALRQFVDDHAVGS